jgi:hypothetical protein
MKIQYPPSSLLVFDLLPSSFTMAGGTVTPALSRLFTVVSAAVVAATVLATMGLVTVGLRRADDAQAPASSWLGAWPGETRVQTVCRLGVFAALCLSFYPLIKGYELGQMQVFINLFAALALLAIGVQRQALAGACLALCCVIKPQLVVVVLWGVVRRRWSFVGGFLAVLVPVELIAIMRFGLDAHVEYLGLLQWISSHGEVFWANQSTNGFVNRLVENGDPLQWQANAFAAYHPAVHRATLTAAGVLVLASLWPPRNTDPRVDLAFAVLAATLAPPVAWEHHFGVAIPIFAVCLGSVIRHRPLGRAAGVLYATSFLLMGSAFLRADILFASRWTGMAGSHLFVGGLVLFGLLLAVKMQRVIPRTAPAIG